MGYRGISWSVPQVNIYYSSMVFAYLHFSIIHSTINKTIYWTCLSNACMLGSCFPNTVGRNDYSCYFVEMFLFVGPGHQTLHAPSHLTLTTTLQGRCLFVWPNIPQWQVGGDSLGSMTPKLESWKTMCASVSQLAFLDWQYRVTIFHMPLCVRK